jgi:hypothetical protein
MTKFNEQLALGTKTASPTRDGRLIILAKRAKAMENYVGEKTTAVDAEQNVTIKVTTMDDMNHSKSSIYGRELLTMTEEQMKEELKDYGVVDIERANSMRDGCLTPNGLHIITFDKRIMPTEVNVGYMKHNVRVYYPRHLRCSKCCKFQHSKKRCPESEMHRKKLATAAVANSYHSSN